jgi:hypothetical protein
LGDAINKVLEDGIAGDEITLRLYDFPVTAE